MRHSRSTRSALREIGLRDTTDQEIFNAARNAGAVVMSKDSDFPELLHRLGPPPQVVWITCGNTSNARLPLVLAATLPDTIWLLEAGEPLVESKDALP